MAGSGGLEKGQVGVEGGQVNSIVKSMLQNRRQKKKTKPLTSSKHITAAKKNDRNIED